MTYPSSVSILQTGRGRILRFSRTNLCISFKATACSIGPIFCPASALGRCGDDNAAAASPDEMWYDGPDGIASTGEISGADALRTVRAGSALARIAAKHDSSSSEPRRGGRMGQNEMAINYRARFAYRIDMRDAEGENTIELASKTFNSRRRPTWQPVSVGPEHQSRCAKARESLKTIGGYGLCRRAKPQCEAPATCCWILGLPFAFGFPRPRL